MGNKCIICCIEVTCTGSRCEIWNGWRSYNCGACNGTIAARCYCCCCCCCFSPFTLSFDKWLFGMVVQLLFWPGTELENEPCHCQAITHHSMNVPDTSEAWLPSGNAAPRLTLRCCVPCNNSKWLEWEISVEGTCVCVKRANDKPKRPTDRTANSTAPYSMFDVQPFSVYIFLVFVVRSSFILLLRRHLLLLLSSCFMFVSFGVCASHRLRYFCWFSSSTVFLSRTHNSSHNTQCASLLSVAFVLHTLSLSLARYSLRIRVMYAVGIYAFALCCVCWHAFIFERVSPCYRIRYSAIMCLSVAIRQQHCTLCESCTAHERRCYSELCVPLHSIHSQCLCIKYLCRRYDSVSLEWSADSDGCHLRILPKRFNQQFLRYKFTYIWKRNEF